MSLTTGEGGDMPLRPPKEERRQHRWHRAAVAHRSSPMRVGLSSRATLGADAQGRLAPPVLGMLEDTPQGIDKVSHLSRKLAILSASVCWGPAACADGAPL